MELYENQETIMKKEQAITGMFRSTVWVLLLVMLAVSAAGGQYELSWYTIDGGGGRSNGGDFTLTGTIGQPDAAWSRGGDYELLGGFWPGGPFCIVEFDDFARFAGHWLDELCNEENNWCDGADLNQLDGVNLIDVKLFVEQWLCYCPAGWPLK